MNWKLHDAMGPTAYEWLSAGGQNDDADVRESFATRTDAELATEMLQDFRASCNTDEWEDLPVEADLIQAFAAGREMLV